LVGAATKGSNNNSGELQIQFHATNNIFYNNIVYANTLALFLNNFTFKPLDPAAACDFAALLRDCRARCIRRGFG
jgi:hypothetical protein